MWIIESIISNQPRRVHSMTAIPPSTSTMSVVREALGMGASTACVIHCVALPWLAAVSALGAMIPAQIHLWLALSSLLLALPLFRELWARNLPSCLLGAVAPGWLLMLAGLLLPAYEQPFTIAGGLLLFFSHMINLRAHRRRHQVASHHSCCRCPESSDLK